MSATYTTDYCNDIDAKAWRNGYKWTINECLRLEREYDLLKLSVPAMASLHNRTVNAIMCKLQAEGLDTFNNLYVQTYGQNSIFDEQENEDQEEDQQIAKINNLASLETQSNDYEVDEVDSIPELNDDYISDLDDFDNEIDGSNHAYVFEQVKRIHKHISSLLSYFTVQKSEAQLNCH